MATKWADHTAICGKLQKAIKEYSAKTCAAQLDAFVTHYRACQDLEEKLSHALVKARSNGVTGDGLSDFRKDKALNDAYQALDKEVDALWQARSNAASWATRPSRPPTT